MRASRSAPGGLRDSGDSVAVDPRSGDLIVKVDEWAQSKLMRSSPSVGVPRPAPWLGVPKLSQMLLVPASVRDGKLLVQVERPDDWFWRLAVLDIATGRVTPIPVPYEGDLGLATWTSDGSVVAAGMPLRTTIWRFRPSGTH